MVSNCSMFQAHISLYSMCPAFRSPKDPLLQRSHTLSVFLAMVLHTFKPDTNAILLPTLELACNDCHNTRPLVLSLAAPSPLTTVNPYVCEPRLIALQDDCPHCFH